MNLEDLQIYKTSLEIGEDVWNNVIKWDYFSKDTVGKQLVRSADSIASNIAEGFGRYHFKENKNFNYYARGSLFETKIWLVKANSRKLIDEKIFEKFMNDLDVLGKRLNSYINSIGTKNNFAND